MSDAGNDVVAGLNLTDGVTVENIGDFADAIRTIALDFDAYKSDIDDSTSLHPEWVRIGAEIRGFENLAAAGTNVFAGVPNSATEFSSNQFAKDDGLEGTITNVGNVPSSNALTSDQLWSPDGAVPDSNTSNSQVYRGPLVDVYASGMAPAGLNGSANGTSFASPEVLVQTVLGRFDAKTEKIIAAE